MVYIIGTIYLTGLIYLLLDGQRKNETGNQRE